MHGDVKTPTDELWYDEDAQRPIYRAIVSRNRFHFLFKCISFHDHTTIRLQFTDERFAKMREVLDIFEGNAKRHYKHSELVCLEETLRNLFSQSNCDFLVFMPDKPGQMGLFFILWRIIPKVKSPISEEERALHTHTLVMEITSDILGTERNLCADRGFTSVEIIEKLYKNDVTYVGTIMKNIKGLPASAKCVKGRELLSIEFYWKKDSHMMCLSYVPKKMFYQSLLLMTNLSTTVLKGSLNQFYFIMNNLVALTFLIE